MTTHPRAPKPIADRRTTPAEADLVAAVDALADAEGRLESARVTAPGYAEALFEFVPDALVLTDRHGLIHDANRAVSALVGYARKYALGKPVAALVERESQDMLASRLVALTGAPEGQTAHWEMRLRPRRQGPPTAVAARVCTLGGVGEGARLLWHLRDITEDLRLAARLAAQEAEAAKALRTRTMELEAVLRMRDMEIAALRQRLDTR